MSNVPQKSTIYLKIDMWTVSADTICSSPKCHFNTTKSPHQHMITSIQAVLNAVQITEDYITRNVQFHHIIAETNLEVAALMS